MSLRLFRLVGAVPLFVSLALGVAAAQQTFHLQTIRISGSQRFREEDLIAALGLKPGMEVDLNSLKHAADALMQTGAIASVQYQYTPLSNGLLVEYTVADGTDFLPCRYDNIIWMSGDDLTKAVHEKVPLYDGQAPTSGELLDQVSQAIADVLAQHGVVTKVAYRLHAQGVGAPIDAILFESETVKPKVREIELTGVTLLSQDEITENTKRLIGDDYSASNVRQSLANGLSFVYGNKGYLRMQVGEPQPAIVGDPRQASLLVGVPISEGLQYKWRGISWTGNTAIPAADLQNAVPLHPGDIADRSKIDLGLAGVRRQYGEKGYLQAKLKRNATFSDQDHIVGYEIIITEGNQFHMGELRMSGLDQPTLAKLQNKWKLNRGDVFNQEYVQSFLKENAGLINAGGKARTVKSSQNLTPEKTVDVSFQF